MKPIFISDLRLCSPELCPHPGLRHDPGTAFVGVAAEHNARSAAGGPKSKAASSGRPWTKELEVEYQAGGRDSGVGPCIRFGGAELEVW